MKYIHTYIAVVAIAALSFGCGGAVQGTTGGPAWTMHKSGMADFDGKKALYATGIGKSRMVQAARDEACGYARVEIGKYIETEVRSLVEASYKSSSDGADAENAGKTIMSGFNNAVKRKLSGVGCVKMWKDPSDGSTYALARFDAAALSGILADVLKGQKSANNLSAELEAKNDAVHSNIQSKIEKRFGK